MRLGPKICGILAAIIAVSIVGGYFLYFRSVVFREDFEDGFGGWSADADVPLDPNNPGHHVEWNVSRVASLAYSGKYSVKLHIDGRQDDGAVWIERRISVRGNSEVRIKVSFQLYSEAESFNAIAGVFAYVGVRNPETEADLAGPDYWLGQANQVAGWKKYGHTTMVNTDSNGEIWVAIGIVVLWETHMTYHIDLIEIEIT